MGRAGATPGARFCLLHGYTGLSAGRRYVASVADTSKALAVLTKDGTAVSAAVRSALIDAARRKASAAIRAEAMQVLRDMETLHAW